MSLNERQSLTELQVVGADSSAMWSHPDLLGSVKQGQNSGVKMGEDIRLNNNTLL